MSPTRRQVVSAVATGAALPATVAAASARQADDEGFSPGITFNPNNLVATVGEREDDVDPDSVTIYTADGAVFEFDGTAGDGAEAGEAFDVGYTYGDSRARIKKWHGIVERVEATKDDETVTAINDNESSLQVSCSLWQTPDEPPTEFTARSEGAEKQHWDRGDQDLSADQRRYGSPGRPLWEVTESHSEIALRVDFQECQPEDEKALWFDCTTVTVTPDELNQGEERIEDVQLTFTDGTTEQPPGNADGDDDDDGAYEPPVTLSGSGEHDGKVIRELHFAVEHGEYTYWNLEADQCSAEREDRGGQGDAGDGGSGGDGSGADEPTETPTGGEPSSDGESTTTARSTDGSDGGNGTGGSSGSGSTDGTSGGSNGAYQDDVDDTSTPQSVEVGDDTVTPSRTAPPDGDGAGPTATASPNGSPGAGNATGDGADGPVTTEGLSGEDQPGMGFVSALGGLLGLGELARRRLGHGDPDAPGDEESG